MTKLPVNLVLICFWALPLVAQSVNTTWVRRYNGPGNDSDYAGCIVVGDSGCVYVAGYSKASGTGFDYATVKYYPNGDTAWVRRYDGPGNLEDRVYALAVDDSGNVYVAGHSFGSEAYPDYATIKYYPNGDTAWVRRYDGPAGDADGARAIAVDDSGCVYVTGYSYGDGTKSDYATVKYHPNGDTAWVRRYNGPEGSYDEAHDMVLDDSGNIYVTGGSHGGSMSSYYDYATVRYYPNGDMAWVRRYNGLGNDHDVARSIAVDDSGNIYVTGNSTGSGTSFDYATVKYHPNGNVAWVKRYNGPGNSEDRVSAMAVDDSGNVYVIGQSDGGETFMDYATVKYYPNGDIAWVRRYNGSANLDDWSGDIAVDNSGNVYVTGSVNGLVKGVAGAEGTIGFHPADANLKRSIESSVAVEADFCTVKYYPNGDTAWVMTYDGPSGGNDSAAAMALDVEGNVYVTGSSSTDETSTDLATIKYAEDAMH